jgi:hypothetical protein
MHCLDFLGFGNDPSFIIIKTSSKHHHHLLLLLMMMMMMMMRFIQEGYIFLSIWKRDPLLDSWQCGIQSAMETWQSLHFLLFLLFFLFF